MATPTYIGNSSSSNITTGSQITSGSLTFTTAASKIVPGATSISLRNNADSADNLIITNAGAVTIRAGLTITASGLTVTAGGITITSGALVVTAGAITATLGDLTLTAGNLIFSTASSRIIPGATSLLFRDAANTNTNVTITDAGAVTVRAGLTITASGLTVTAGGATITSGDLTLTAGNVVFNGTSTKIVQPVTSLLIRDHADANTNVTILDAGGITTRSSITIGATGLRFTAGSSADGSVSTLQTGAGNGETINTAGLGTARYIAVAARTGVILQSGTYDGQVVIVINEDTTAGNSITFAAVATSHVANGVTTVINGLTGKRFVWSASAATAAWYAC